MITSITEAGSCWNHSRNYSKKKAMKDRDWGFANTHTLEGAKRQHKDSDIRIQVIDLKVI
jgi:hypothetical protein